MRNIETLRLNKFLQTLLMT